MTKLLATALLYLFGHASHAQLSLPKGTFQVSGAVSYMQQRTDAPRSIFDQLSGSYLTTRQHTTNTTFYTSPAVGYFVAQNLVVGVGIMSTSQKQETTYDDTLGQLSNGDQVMSSVNVGVFAQYYRLVTDWFGLTSTLGASVGSYQVHAHPYGTSYDSYGFATSLTPGLVIFPTPRLALGSSIGGLTYGRSSSDGGSVRNSSFGANFGLSYLTFSGTFFWRRG